MPSFLRRIVRYDFSKLVDTLDRDRFFAESTHPQIICDIDKTYLETEFESVVSMIKIAMERPDEKVTVQGASTVLNALRWGDQSLELADQGYPRGLHFVSSSPRQLRSTLEHKLALDGLDWSSDTFKNQTYNIIMGRMDLLRKHVAYKSAAILNLCQNFAQDVPLYLIGDNAEADAFVYLGLAWFLSHKLSPLEYANYLQIVGVEKQTSIDLVKSFRKPPLCRVAGIFIRNAPGYEFRKHPVLSQALNLFNDYYHLSWQLLQCGLIQEHKMSELTRTFHNQHLFSKQHLGAHVEGFKAEVSSHHACAISCTEILGIKEFNAPFFSDCQYKFAELSSLDSYSGYDRIKMVEEWFSQTGKRKGKTH